jgi:2-octaprenyl-6-methoxyphenol hydroxylase
MSALMRDGAEHIVIIGGGPIGLTTALLLADAGYHVSVIEGRDAASARADRRLLALSRGTWHVLAPLLPVAPPHARIDTVVVSSAGEFGTTRINASELDGASGEPLGITVHYGALCDALEQAVGSAERQTRIAVLRPARAIEVTQQNDGAAVTLEDGRSLAADLVLHAEGGAGPQRAENPEQAGAKNGTQDGKQDGTLDSGWALLADVQLSGPAAGIAFERFTREGPLALLPTVGPQGRGWSLVWCSDAAAAAQRRALGDADFVAALQAAIGLRAARVLSAGPRHAVRLAPQTRAQIHEHRVAWLGNAAQTLHPVAGQGFNLGVRDACTLVAALRAHREQGRTDVPSALISYGRDRSADRRLITGITRWLPAVFATRAWPIALGRSLGLTALDLAPPLRRQWAHLLMFGVR